MNTPQPLLDEVKNRLPTSWHETVDRLAERLLPSDAPLRIILLGAFSVGKSSLLNTLIGEPLLQTAREETTALPTFIEYGPTRTMQLIGSDGSVLPLDADGLARATTEAPEGAACAAVALPLDWLRGISIVDLPGLGGMSSRNRDYTAAQIQQADAVLYLIAPRGPDAADMATLRQIAGDGKRVKLLVARWDEIEEAVTRGEQRPDLDRWSSQIESQAGIRARLAPVSRHGLGCEDIRDFLARARDDRGAIRLRRLCAELRPLLENALGQNADAQRACAARSEEDTRVLRSELLQRRTALTELKSTHHARAREAREALSVKARGIVQQGNQGLDRALIPLAETVQEEADWETFSQDGAEALRAALSAVARGLSELSAEHGGLDLPEAQVTALNLRLPPTEPVAPGDFLDLARFSQLQSELEARAGEFAAQAERLARLPEMDLTEPERALRELLTQREQLAALPLPRIIERIEGSNAGAMFGRMLGEIADVGLWFVAAPLAGLKVASLVGKTAKVAGVAVNTARIASTVTKTIEVAQTVRKGGELTGMVPPPIADKLKMLEGLSLGYWGERIGAALSGGPQEIEVIDPEAQAQQRSALAVLDTQAREARAQLARCEDIANERQLTGWALEQSRKEQAHLQTRLDELTRRAEERRQAYEQSARAERLSALQRQVERALAHWRRGFEQQTGHMTELLRARARDDWETRIEALLGERLAELETLELRIESAPAEREAALERLRMEAEGVRAALAVLD
ncbi:dynamin family protein [uncultured Thiocystis sp.]|jgi:hypothetical protein|uniref:dynamin family protein n=1 Tax=uncultured Thiocystis sp. TaxID=1202134 RepID=UPI0025D8B2CB|nr:dynamin family protein [uncultured Thiocystis sp.]